MGAGGGRRGPPPRGRAAKDRGGAPVGPTSSAVSGDASSRERGQGIKRVRRESRGRLAVEDVLLAPPALRLLLEALVKLLVEPDRVRVDARPAGVYRLLEVRHRD